MSNATDYKKSATQFLKTDGGKTKSNAIEVPAISLPKGGGAIKGIDEKFSVNAINGTASFSIPLPFAPARGASIPLSVSYNSGGGNGVFGLGWNLSLPSIKRKTDKGLPRYFDTIDSDTFIFSGAEDLVPEYQKEADGSFSVDTTSGDYILKERITTGGVFVIRSYKPRIEGLFARIERWLETATGIIKWRVTTKDNVTTLFGWTISSVITNPGDATRIFEWLPEFIFDDKGNCSQYIYKKEDALGLDVSLIHNRNRTTNGSITYTNQYLQRVLYGNITPYIQFGDDFPVETDYMFQTVFDYGEYSSDAPYTKTNAWNFRRDAFSEYKPGFEIRTTRLCKRVLLFHFFSELPGGSALVKSTDFEYDTTTERDFTFLKSITSVGYIKQAELPEVIYSSKKLPATEFEYQKHEWNSDIKVISTEDLVHAPSGLDEQQYQFTDLYNEGLSGILTEQSNGWHYKHNLGNGQFEQAQIVNPKPSFSGLGRQLQLADLDADGGKQLVSFSTDPKGYFELEQDEWQPFRDFRSLPNIDFGDANTRMLDLNGDGRPELLITEDDIFKWYESEGREGFSEIHKSFKAAEEEAGPQIVFADPKQTTFLADMSGDGMTDIVRIQNGAVCYWPNLGYGNFGAKIAMDNAPTFDHPDKFNPTYLRLADIDGSGTTDIIYLGENKFTCWLNLSGNSFHTAPFEIDPFPEVSSHTKITVTDLLGNGVACITWSSPLPKDNGTQLKYIDLMNSRKPHIMVSYKNNLGKEVYLEYAASTKFYIDDKLAGTPWVTKLHFPVHCIAKTETVDKVSGFRFVSSYKYHHGYYDHAEREFRGFGMVEQTDSEHFEHWAKGDASNIVDKELHQEPVISKSWVHTGAFISREKILNQFTREYWHAEMARQGYVVTNNEITLPDARIIAAPGMSNTFIDHLSDTEWREALRACKGMALRSEIFAHDAPLTGATPDELIKQLTPYTVATHNCVIELLQPKGKNKYAVFVVKESEAITYSYERNTADPRIAHNLNIRLDEYGNVLESAAVVYPRNPDILESAALPPQSLSDDVLAAQAKTVIIYTQSQFTNDVIEDDQYRLRLPSEVKTYEVENIFPTSRYYSIADLLPAATTSQRRLIEHIRSVYLDDADLQTPLPLGSLKALALPYEGYQLAYTNDLLTNIYAERATDTALVDLMVEGKFLSTDGDTKWWVRSGTTQFIANSETPAAAQSRFYVPLSYTDPYGSKTKVHYYSNYYLFIEETEDELGNKSGVDLFNFRTLSPQRLRDINGNFSEAISNELGMVKAMAVFGKGNEADNLTGLNEYTDPMEATLISNFFNIPETIDGITDSVLLAGRAKQLLGHATARFVYDFDAYKNTGKPAVVASILREEHFKQNAASAVQLSFEYSNGFGKVVMKKVQAEPGDAKHVTINPDDTYTITDVDTSTLLRWIGNGRTLLNNKGNPVKQYEPYFSTSPQYEDFKELVETGVTPIMYYDAMGRQIKTEMPNGTFSKVVFDSWRQSVYDANDTLRDSVWYLRRTDNNRPDYISDVQEQSAAAKANAHYDTPNVLHFDTLGRPVLSIEHNKDIAGVDQFNETCIVLDVEGNLRSVTDARGNTVMQYQYDMLGNLVYQHSMDAGQRWLLTNILGNPLRTWDERGHEFRYFYDALHRPLYSSVLQDDGPDPLNHIFERIVYGDTEASPELKNLRGKPIAHYDSGGVVLTGEYDFKGQPMATTRKLFRNYRSVANWIMPMADADLETEEFTFITETDALGRITRQTAPDGSIITPQYNQAGLLNGESVSHIGPGLTMAYLKNIDYNEKGQRELIRYGNDVTTKFYYDKATYRLIRLESKKYNNEVLQDLRYTYDPVGNITTITDEAIPISFFANAAIEATSDFTYDALYRLVKAIGRENSAGFSFGSSDNWNDAPFMHQMNPGDGMGVWGYTQNYAYDAVGNIQQMKHVAAGNNWTRNYSYATINNRLLSTKVGNNSYSYTYHAQQGFITAMPHLDDMGWNFKEELVRTIRQHVTAGNGTAETTYYQYDGQGQRIRKITENAATTGNTPTKKEERIYIAGYETYRTYQANTIVFERQSLSLLDEGHRFVMVETVKQNAGTVPQTSEAIGTRLTRYQLHNHLGSAALELDDNAAVISYEEYHPYGTTAFQAKNNTIKAAAKRYRYTGMERDEETGLEYHSARYYVPWLGRWCSADPIGIGDGVNVYGYCRGNPVVSNDADGTQTNSSKVKTEKKKINENIFPPLVIKIKTMDKDNTLSIPVQDPYVKANNLKTAEAIGKKRDVEERAYRSSHQTIDDQGHVNRLNSNNPFISSLEHMKDDLKNYKGDSDFMKFSIMFNTGSAMASNFGAGGREKEILAEKNISFNTTLPLKVNKIMPVQRGKNFEKTQQAKGGINTNELKNNFLIIDNISTEGKFISIADGGLKYGIQKFQILLNVSGSQAKWNQMLKDLKLHAGLTVSEEDFFMNAQIIVPEGNGAELKEAIKNSEWGKDLFEKYGQDVILNKVIEAPR